MKQNVNLGDVLVSDVSRFLVKDPIVIKSDCSIDKLAEKFIENPKSRYVYVVDEGDRLVGSVRMNTMVRYLFPFSAANEYSSEVVVGNISGFSAERVSEIMNEDPFYITEDDSLDVAATILIREKINELPVIDKEHQIIGQLNVYEIIEKYLKQGDGS